MAPGQTRRRRHLWGWLLSFQCTRANAEQEADFTMAIRQANGNAPSPPPPAPPPPLPPPPPPPPPPPTQPVFGEDSRSKKIIDTVPGFVLDLEYCIKNHALKLAETFPKWGNKCDAVTAKVDFQATVYEETLTPIMNKHGYTGALWCAMYSLGMVPIVDTSQPNNPNFDVWYKQLMCPWDFPKDCGASDEELTEHEVEGQMVCPQKSIGDPAKCAPHQHPQYEIWSPKPFQTNEPLRRTMSCALCGRLSRTFAAGAPVGAPDLIKANVGVEYSLKGVPEEEREHYTAWWDTHAFGAWLANGAAKNGHTGMWDRDALVEKINLFKASNGEEIHGFLWQSLRLLAHEEGILEGSRIPDPPHKVATLHAHQVCQPMWSLAPQTMNDCAHAAGHVRRHAIQ